MRRLFAILLMLALLTSTLVLSGCHGARSLEPFTMPESLDETKQYEITFWAKNDTNKAQTNVYEKAISDFEALYPNIKVKLRLYTDYGRIYNDVITNITTQTTPNVCITYPDHIATYMTGANVVLPLDAIMDDARYGLGGSELKFDSPTREEIVPQFLSEGVIGGVQYALPYMRSTEACYINKDYVEKLGFKVPDVLTWDFIWEVSEAAAIKNADGTYKLNSQTVMIPFIYKSTDNMMISQLKQLGADYSDPDGNVLIFNETTRELLRTVAKHTESGAFSTFKFSSYPANFLNAGQCVFAIDSTAGATWMGSDAPLIDISEDKLVRFETVVRPIPQFDPKNPSMISQGPSICVFNKRDSGEVLASWLFAQFLLTNDVQIGYAQTEGYVPVTKTAQESNEYRDYLARAGEDNALHYYVKMDASKLLLDNVENTFVTPVWNGSASLRDASGQLIEHVVKSIKRSETVDEAYLDALRDKIIALYRLDSLGAKGSEVKRELGPMPTGSIALIVVLLAAWIAIGGTFLTGELRKRKKSRKNSD